MCPPEEIKNKMKINKTRTAVKREKWKIYMMEWAECYKWLFHFLLPNYRTARSLNPGKENIRGHLVHSPISHLLIN